MSDQAKNDIKRLRAENESLRALLARQSKEVEALRAVLMDLRRAGGRLAHWVRAVVDKKEPLDHWRTLDSVEDVERAVKSSYEKFPAGNSPTPAKPEPCEDGAFHQARLTWQIESENEGRWIPCPSCAPAPSKKEDSRD